MGLKESLRQLVPKVSFGEEVSVEKSSDGITRDAWYAETFRKQGNPPPANLDQMLQLFLEDPIVNTAVTTRVNAILDNGWTVEGKDTPKTDADRVLKKVGFTYSFLRQFFLNAILYRNVFIEIERTASGTPVSLHILEAPQMEIVHDKHGEIESFKQVGVTGQEVTWSPDDIVYVPFDRITTSVWGSNGFKSLYRTINTRHRIEAFLESLAETNAWRDVLKVRRMNKDDIGSAISYLRDAQSDATFPYVVNMPENGEFEFTKIRDPSDLKDFKDTLDNARSQILMFFKVPPIMVGLPDNSNRSNSDTQSQSFQIANNADRTLAADAFNAELFSKLGIGPSVVFSWNPIDSRSEKDDVEMAEKLMNMGGKPEKVEEFLRKAGLDIPADFFPTAEEMEAKQRAMFEQQSAMKKTPDDAASRPSRARKGDEASEKIGTGRNATTRDDQL